MTPLLAGAASLKSVGVLLLVTMSPRKQQLVGLIFVSHTLFFPGNKDDWSGWLVLNGYITVKKDHLTKPI